MRIMRIKRRVRKGISLALAAALTLSLAGSSLVMAAEPEDQTTVRTSGVVVYDDGDCGATSSDEVYYYWDTSDYTMTIYGSGAMQDYDEESETDWADYYTEIYAVVIEDGITEIGGKAFSAADVDEYNLTSLTIGNTVTRIGKYAFRYCQGLTEVTIPASVTSIEKYAFAYCTGLESVTFEGDAPDFGIWVFDDVETTVYYPADNDTWTEDVMSDYGGDITWVAYGDSSSDDSESGSGSSLTAVGLCGATDDDLVYWLLYDDGSLVFYGTGAMEDYSLYNDGSTYSTAPWQSYRSFVTSLTINSGVTSIGTGAFVNCYNLTEVSLSAGITSIGGYAFAGCDSLTNITLPAEVTEIGDFAFGYDSSLSVITFTGDAPSFGDNVFYGTASILWAYYPTDNDTWTSDVLQSYGGTVAWAAYESSDSSDDSDTGSSQDSSGGSDSSDDSDTEFSQDSSGSSDSADDSDTGPSQDSSGDSDAETSQDSSGSSSDSSADSSLGSVSGSSGSSSTGGSSSTVKAAQKITVKAASLKKSFKASKLKKKKQTFQIKASAKGKLTYKKLSGSNKIKVSKTGKVTVKKGTKKKTYKVTVQIKAAATAGYASQTVNKTLKITVK